MSRKRKPLPTDLIEADIESLTPEGRGLSHRDGKAVFIHGALAGERVLFRYTRMRTRYDEGVVAKVLQPSSERVEPECPHFGLCGGCSLQHLESEAQIRFKQAGLAELLTRIGRVSPTRWLEPLKAGSWGYRRKARIGVRHLAGKNRTLVGFRERGNAFLADLMICKVLHSSVGERLTDLAALIHGLTIRDQIPQIEIAMGDTPAVLVLRVLKPPTAADLDLLLQFAARTGLHLYVQDGGPETIRPLSGQHLDLYYCLPAHQIRIAFEPSDFTQINLELNRTMVDRALDLLRVQPTDRILDLFCGLGNFTLPLARSAAAVTGVEGDPGLVERAHANAAANGLHNVEFYSANLAGALADAPWLRQRFTAALLDPPRSGAFEILDWLPRLGIERLLYISCYPATLARDADRLVHELGYTLQAAGVMDMFPQTSHVESMALFERNDRGR